MRHARLLALSTTALLSLAACDNDPVATELQEATVQLDSLAAGGARRPTLEHETKTFERVASTARRLASNAQGGQKAAAQLLAARAELGLAESALARAQVASRVVESHIRQARAGLSAWNALSSQAAALTAPDTLSEIDRIERAIPDKQNDLSRAREQLRSLEAELAELNAQADGLDRKAGDLRDSAMERQRELPVGDGAQRVEMAKQIQSINREADQLEARSSLLRAEAEIRSRDLPMHRIELAEHERQLALMIEARDGLEAAQSQAQSEADRLGDRADEAAGEIIASVAAAGEAHKSEANPAYEEAIEAFGRARSAASQARSVDRRGASALLSEAHHGLAGAMMANATLGASRLGVLEAISGAEPGIPGRDGLTEDLLALREQTTQQKAEAVEAYREAISSVESVGASGDQDQNRLDNSLRNLYAVIGEEAPIPDREEFEPIEDEPAESQATGEEETIEGFIARVQSIIENERYDEIWLLVRAEQEPAAGLLGGIEQVVGAFGRLDSAMSEQFGLTMAEIAEQAQEQGGMPFDASQFTGEFEDAFDPDSMIINYEGDDVALLSAPETPDDPLVLVRTEAGWIVDLDETFARSSQDLSQMDAVIGILPTVSEAMDDVAEEIAAGTHDSPDAAMQALMQRLMPVIFGLMGQMQQGGAG